MLTFASLPSRCHDLLCRSPVLYGLSALCDMQCKLQGLALALSVRLLHCMQNYTHAHRRYCAVKLSVRTHCPHQMAGMQISIDITVTAVHIVSSVWTCSLDDRCGGKKESKGCGLMPLQSPLMWPVTCWLKTAGCCGLWDEAQKMPLTT